MDKSITCGKYDTWLVLLLYYLLFFPVISRQFLTDPNKESNNETKEKFLSFFLINR